MDIALIRRMQTVNQRFVPRQRRRIGRVNPDNDFGKLFAATSFPTLVVLGKSGKVEGVHVGNNAALEAKINGYLTKSLATK